MPRSVDLDLQRQLIRDDRQEDLAFGLWTPSIGNGRGSALLHTVLMPQDGDRHVHGNVSFQPHYFERVCREAMAGGCGIAFMHSHPFPGWQGMSDDDVRAEKKMAGATTALTGLPLLGLTIGDDGTWSARTWTLSADHSYDRRWCEVVRVVGDGLRVHFADSVLPPPLLREEFRRTVSIWGAEAHARLARLRVGIVGLGSVGALVAESLSRMGLRRFVLIDFDRVEHHNLDRLVIATSADVGRLKVEVAAERIKRVATAAEVDVRTIRFSVVESDGYRSALDCDVLFSCVDRPRPRHILNHLAFGHLIPVIDGGIQVRFRGGQFTGVDWQVQTAMPGSVCLECLGAYNAGDVSTEAAGKLDDPSYMAGLPADHRLRRNENVFPFAANVASLEILQLIAMVTRVAGISTFGVQRFRYVPGVLEQAVDRQCRPDCDRIGLVARGDDHFSLAGRDLSAEAARDRAVADRTRRQQGCSGGCGIERGSADANGNAHSAVSSHGTRATSVRPDGDN